MEPYRNVAGDSAVVAYEIGDDSIKVLFRDGWIYTYNNESTGHSNIEHMKTLASAGSGLANFISRVVKAQYAAKSR
ncbi:MAG: hypothetical protein ABIV47_23250 [Roseiflexaceae bacterium]